MGIFFGWLFLSIIVGAIGSDRKIGFFVAFLAALFLSPIIGIIITLSSKTNEQIKQDKRLLDIQQNQLNQLRNNKQDSIADELIKYKKLLDDGVIDQQEYERLRSRWL